MEQQLAELAEEVRDATERLLAVLPPVVYEEQFWDGSDEHLVRDLVAQLGTFDRWRSNGCIEDDFERTAAELQAAESWEVPPDLSPADLLAAQLLVVARGGADAWKLVLGFELDPVARERAVGAAVAYLDARGWGSA